MDLAVFEGFRQECVKGLPNEVDRILKEARGEEACAIGFITTDDFYGFYLVWDYSRDLSEYYDWEKSSDPEFLYQPLVDVVEACKEIDFCNPSEEKWAFAQALLSVLADCVGQIPEEVFQRNGFLREEVLFFATMGDGDYVQEMMEASVKILNAQATLEAYGVKR